MAKFECTLRDDFDEVLNYFHEGILGGSMSASYEDESYVMLPVCVAVSVYTSGTAYLAATA